jgi:dipeptidyl-peptidase-4
MTRYSRLFVSLLCLGMANGVFAAQAELSSQDANSVKQKELKLEDLMPEKSVFGPSARHMAFSFDGQYGAYLYRPYKERRHGDDLFLYDVKNDQVKRITWPSVMARFQKKARDVIEDRKKKAKTSEEKSDSDKKKDKADADVKKETGQPGPSRERGNKPETKKGKTQTGQGTAPPRT